MQIFSQEQVVNSAIVGWGARVMLLADATEPRDSKAGIRIAGLGGQIELRNDAFSAINALKADLADFDLFVIECDPMGGLAASEKLVALLREDGVGMPVILVSSECREQAFPQETCDPIILRAPVSAVSLRVGFEHAMRDRTMFHAA
ncbi:hypothetical protein [Pseudorhodobacter sp.]|uniref:hypothetical protein n=1 Tax=Pseudorhodobacter sp. TaxID=1934400 RepID=UPI0026494938|nr:hypothetical protein [Pseudorhodobacter sp.]MDN5788967.1 hypothetical protein [Pseudorhodobacter sp.]